MYKLFLGLAIVFALSSCGGNKETQSTENETSEVEVQNTPSEELENNENNNESPVLNEVEAEVDSIGNEIDNVVNDLN